MKSILDFVTPSYDGLKGRESIEWANFFGIVNQIQFHCQPEESY